MRSIYENQGPKAEWVPTNNQSGWDQDPVETEEV